MNETTGTAQPADAGQVDRPVGRPVPKRYEDGRIKGGCSLHETEDGPAVATFEVEREAVPLFTAHAA